MPPATMDIKGDECDALVVRARRLAKELNETLDWLHEQGVDAVSVSDDNMGRGGFVSTKRRVELALLFTHKPTV